MNGQAPNGEVDEFGRDGAFLLVDIRGHQLEQLLPPLVCEGTWEGRILEAPRGDGGFGYDPVFYDPLMGLAAAEMDLGSKHRVSHRGQALLKLRWAMTRGRIAYALR